MESDASHHAQKDDESAWGEPERAPRSERRRLAALVSVRFSPEEEELVREVAQRRGQSLSGFVRHAALKEAAPPSGTSVHGSIPTTTTRHTSPIYESLTIKIVGPESGAIVREVVTR